MSEHEFSELDIDIKPAEESQLDFIETMLPNNTTKRYDVQRSGEGIYLVAWHQNTPVGGFLLRWSGPDDAHVTRHVDIIHSAFLEGGLTIDAYRRKGVATAVIRTAERLAKEKGCTHIGMEVGSTDNPEARRLYEKLGYVDWGFGEFTISWEAFDIHGNRRTDSEVVIFMQKSLNL